jgi:GH3 auxin-responsive promoter
VTGPSRLLEQFSSACDETPRAQSILLLEQILAGNIECAFGRRHSFGAIRSVEDYRRAVPLADYESFRPSIDRMLDGDERVLVDAPVSQFFITSGSAAAPKYIPATASFLRAKWRAFSIYWQSTFLRHPDARAGSVVTSFADSGSVETSPGGTPCSSETTFWSSRFPRLSTEDAATIPKGVSGIADYETRYEVIARILLEANVSLLMALNPSTIAVLFDRMNRYSDEILASIENGGIRDDPSIESDLRDLLVRRHPPNPTRANELRAARDADGGRLLAASCWPQLRVLACWRSPMLRPYLDRLEAHCQDVDQIDFVSTASEGILAIPLGDVPRGGVLAVDTHFYEFVPEEQWEHDQPETLLAHELEPGRDYAIVLSTTAGLYRYEIGDVVRVLGYRGRAPVIEFRHRMGATSSLTGEKLTEDQVAQSVLSAAEAGDLRLASFLVFPAKQPFPHYVLMVEFAAAPPCDAVRSFARRFDSELGERNVEYSSKRSSARLAHPEVWLARAGEFEAWRRRRVASGANDDQLKTRYLTRATDVAADFEIEERVHAD